MAEARFKHCRLRVDGDRVVTAFDDGTEVPAVPVFDEDSTARARSLGYRGSDRSVVRQMTWHHDLLHHVFAEAVGHPYSPTLHAVAHGYELAPGVVEREERAVMLLHRLVNDGLEDVVPWVTPTMPRAC